MADPGRPYQRTTTSVLAAEDPAERARRNGISPALATSKEARAAEPMPALKGAVKVGAFPDKSRYPFQQIAADGGVWKINPAEFRTKPQSVRSAASKWAIDRGLQAKVVVDDGHVYVQFTRKEEV
jgi:hypothetical protein